RRAAEAVDRLVRIADGKHIGLVSHEQAGQLDLGDVGILKLVDQHETRTLLSARQVGGVLLIAQQRYGAGDDVAVGAEVLRRQQIFGIAKDPRDLVATAEYFVIRHRLGIFCAPDARQRKLFALQLRYVGVIVVGRAQLVVAALEETNQPFEEFAGSGGLNVVAQPQVLDAAAQQYIEVLVVDQFEALTGLAE